MRTSPPRSVFGRIVLWSTLAIHSVAWAAIAPANHAIEDSLTRQIKSNQNGKTDFAGLVKTWERDLSSSQKTALLKIALDPRREDPVRYAAWMGSVRIQPTQARKHWSSLIKDSSWMMRSAALKSFLILASPSGSDFSILFSMLKDPAWVVRDEAIGVLARLQPKGSEEALLGILNQPEYAVGGKVQFVAKDALQALVGIRPHSLLLKNPQMTARIRECRLARLSPSFKREIEKNF